MNSSTAKLATVFLVVAAALFTGVYLLLTGGPDPANDVQTPPPLEIEDGDTNTTETGRQKRLKGGRKTTSPDARTLVIAGRVTDGEGQAVAGALVTQILPAQFEESSESADWEEIKVLNVLFDIDEEEWSRPRPIASLSRLPTDLGVKREVGLEITTTQTDEAGEFRIEYRRGMGVGPFQIKATKDDVGSATANGVRGRAPDDGERIELRLGGKGVVKGVVLSGAEGHRIPGAYVILDDGDQRYSGVCDADGSFAIEDIGPGQYMATAGATGHAPLTSQLVQVAEDRPVELRLPRGVDLIVTATAETEDDEVTVAGATIYALHDETYTYLKGTTGPDGQLIFTGLPPGTWIVNGMAKDLASFSDELIALKQNDGRKEVSVYFEQTVVTPIVVRDPNGRPISGVRFYTATWDDEYDQARSVQLPGETDANGSWGFRFEFDGPRAAVFAVAEGHGMTYIAPDDETDGDTLEITLAPGAILHGKLTDENGGAVADGVVEIEIIPDDDDAEDVIVQVRTDADGKYRFAYAAQGEITISAWSEDDYSDDVSVVTEPGKTDYEINLTFGEE